MRMATPNCLSHFWKILQNIWLKALLLVNKYWNRNAQIKIKSENDCEYTLERRIIPEVKGLPLVGTLLDLIAAGGAPKLHKYIDQRHQTLGPIFRERLGGTQDAVFVSSASLMRSVFLMEGQFPRHPLPEAWQLYNKKHNCQRGLFFMEGTEWYHNRRLLNRHLLNGNLDWMNEHIEASTNKLMEQWRLGKELEFKRIDNLEQHLYRWAIEVICSIMFGNSATSHSEIECALDGYTKIVHKIFENSALLMNFPPKLAKLLNMKMWTEFEQNVHEVLQKGGEIIDMFVRLSKEEVEVDAESLFCKLQDAEMDAEMIKRIFVDLVIAAGDTTAYTSEWALYLLAQQADLQLNIAKDVLSGGSNLDLIQGLIKETLRLFPVAPFIGRYAANDAQLGGYEIKKKYFGFVVSLHGGKK